MGACVGGRALSPFSSDVPIAGNAPTRISPPSSARPLSPAQSDEQLVALLRQMAGMRLDCRGLCPPPENLLPLHKLYWCSYLNLAETILHLYDSDECSVFSFDASSAF